MKLPPCLKNPRLRAAFGLTAVLATGGCSALRAPHLTEGVVPIPARWQHGSSMRSAKQPQLDQAALAVWWERFHDPALTKIIRIALENSPDVRTALSRIDEAQARRRVARADLFPTISGGASGQGTETHARGAGSTGTESYGANLNLSWEIDLFGRIRQNLKAATADAEQAEENYFGARVALAADVAIAYVNLRAAETQLEIVRESLATRGETVKITKWREQAGEGSGLETQQAVSTLEQARAAISPLQETIEQARNQLALLAGQTPGTFDSIVSKPKPVPEPPSRLALGIPAETLRQRPDIRAAERAVVAAVARTRAANAERFPTLSLNGSLGIDALQAGHIFSPESAAASLAGNLVAPIFNAGRIRANIEIQSQQERQALIAYESTVLRALSEVENALISIQRNNERLATLNNAVTAAREAATLAQQQYEAGEVDLLVVLDAQRTLLSLQDQQTTTLGNRAAAHVQLYEALGGGWQPHP